MAENYEEAFKQAIREDTAYQNGWDSARDWYKDSFLAFFEDYKEMTPAFDIPVTMFSRQDIEDIFKEVPESPMDLLYQAALNRGQP